MNKPYLITFYTLCFCLLAGIATGTSVDSIKSPKLWLKQQNELGQAMLKDGLEFDNAVEIFKIATEFAEKQNLTSDFNELLIGYGIALYKNGDIQRSYITLLEALPKIKDSELKLKAEVNQIQGMNLVFQDKFPEGYKHQMEALKYYSDMGDSTGLMSVYYDLGTNFGSQGQPKLALKNYEKGIEIAKLQNNPKMTILGITAIGGSYASMNDFEQALSYSSESIELAKQLNDDEELAWAAINRGHILGRIDRFEEALYYLQKAYDLSFIIGNKLLTAYSLEQTSDIKFKQNRINEALEALDEGHQIFKDLGQNSNVKNIIQKYAEIYFKQKDYVKYKEYNDKYMALKDSLYSQEMMESMANLKQDFEIHKMERENQIALLKKDQEINNAQSYATIAIVCAAGMVLMLLLSLMYMKNKSAIEKNELLSAKNAEILRQNEFLAASNQDLEKFAYIISHDLKEPLRNINGFTKLLMRKLKRNNAEQEVSEYAEFITNGTRQMEELLSGLLEYSKLNSNRSEKNLISAKDNVQKVVDNLEIQLNEKNCNLEIENLPKVHFRGSQMSQLFQNLIANSIKFGKQEGNSITIGSDDLGEEYRFFVKDTGIGIDPEYQKDIFVVFKRLNNRKNYSGSGIGLATCKKIVEDHGGRIWVISTPGEGSCFYFTVPKKPRKDLFATSNDQNPADQKNLSEPSDMVAV